MDTTMFNRWGKVQKRWEFLNALTAHKLEYETLHKHGLELVTKPLMMKLAKSSLEQSVLHMKMLIERHKTEIQPNLWLMFEEWNNQ